MTNIISILKNQIKAKLPNLQYSIANVTENTFQLNYYNTNQNIDDTIFSIINAYLPAPIEFNWTIDTPQLQQITFKKITLKKIGVQPSIFLY